MTANRIIPRRTVLILAAALLFPESLDAADAVNVTIEADATVLAVGGSTTVTVYGLIDSAIEADSDQVFSWYLDVLNDNGAAVGGYDNVRTPAADNHPDTSGDGTAEGSNLRGVYDTFLSNSGAGKGSRVVLVQFEVTALAAGTSTLRIAAGTTVGALSDFLVLGTTEGFHDGGNYSAASVEVSVQGDIDLSNLDLNITAAGSGVNLTFNPITGYDHVVQFSDTLLPMSWTDLPGTPHDSGMASDDRIANPKRFYRVALTPR